MDAWLRLASATWRLENCKFEACSKQEGAAYMTLQLLQFWRLTVLSGPYCKTIAVRNLEKDDSPQSGGKSKLH